MSFGEVAAASRSGEADEEGTESKFLINSTESLTLQDGSNCLLV